MSKLPDQATARDRLLLHAALLLDGADGADIPTRAILEAAGVQAPTLYHHFGNKQGLLDAVVEHGYRQHLRTRPDPTGPADPLDAVRQGWDAHVAFGLAHPHFVVHVYGHVRPEQPCGVIALVRTSLLDTLLPAARQGRLQVTPEAAAGQLLAASTGVVLTLVNQRPDERDPTLSPSVRDAVLAGIVATDQASSATATASTAGAPGPAAAAIALAVALHDDTGPLRPAEVALLQDWLTRLAGG